MRIIAGSLKAKRLQGPKNERTRPTLDRVKEAMFSIILPHIQGAHVLDLFSGTGNLSFESISRGAKYALLNEIDSRNISTIKSNAMLTNLNKYVKITRNDYLKCLGKLEKTNETFDIIFLDPPYDSKYGIKALEYISNTVDKILSEDGIIVYETDKNFINKITKEASRKSTVKLKIDVLDILDNFKNLECIDTRIYGNVILKMYKWR